MGMTSEEKHKAEILKIALEYELVCRCEHCAKLPFESRIKKQTANLIDDYLSSEYHVAELQEEIKELKNPAMSWRDATRL